jgi:hypothetical protein
LAPLSSEQEKLFPAAQSPGSRIHHGFSLGGDAKPVYGHLIPNRLAVFLHLKWDLRLLFPYGLDRNSPP